MSVAAVANGWSGYFLNGLHALGVDLPHALTAAPTKGGIANVPAIMIILALMAMLIVGVKESARLNAVMVSVKLITITIFLIAAGGDVKVANWSPFMPYGWFSRTPDGHSVGVFAGAALVFFAYIGFDAVTTAAEEAKNPQRDLPLGILSSLAICTVVYIIVSAVLTGVVSYTDLNVASPVAHALELLGHRWASGLVAVGVIAGLITVMLVLYYGLTRILFAMSRDGLLPPLGELAELVNIGTLFAFVMVCLGVIVLRATQPNLKRPFRTPGHPIIPLLGALSCGALMVFLPAITWIRFVVWLGIGVIFYFTYSYRHSRLATVAS
jgi:APA family basic amino acid/polyamine antiporter